MSSTQPPSSSVRNGNSSRRCRTIITSSLMLLAASASLPAETLAFSSNAIISRSSTATANSRLSLQTSNNNEIKTNGNHHDILRPILSTVTAATLALVTISPLTSNVAPAFAYEESDYASETVTSVVSQLKSNAGDVDGTFNTLEEVAKIITEGKGVGGTLTYDGVRLTEGTTITDEDTTIYNPGLSLLTGSEKERLVSAIIDNRAIGLSTKHWSENNEYAFDFLKTKLDPLHMHELGGYLKILPFWGAALYLGVLFVQQNNRGFFPLVYGLCALGVFGPVFLLVANGP